MNSNDFNCSSNIEKLISECDRLSEIAKRKTAIISQRKKEFEKFQTEKKKFEQETAAFNGAIVDQQTLKQKDNEIHYLQSQLAKKDDENSKVKVEMEKLLLDQMNSIDTMKNKGGVDALDGGDPQESSQIITQLNKKIEILQY